MEVMEYVGFLLMTTGAALVDMAGFNILPYACFVGGLMLIFVKALLEEKENENKKKKSANSVEGVQKTYGSRGKVGNFESHGGKRYRVCRCSRQSNPRLKDVRRSVSE